jgi:TPR repeat protein
LAGVKAICALLVLALVASDPALAARKKKSRARARPAAVSTPTPPPASVRQGVEYWRAGKWEEAVKMWQPFAEKGDADAMFNMGQAWKLGRGVALDKGIAQDWYRRAAVKGHLPAQANLGILLFQGGDKADAVRWLKSAADKGEMRAQYVLGIVHWNGDGAAKSMPLAYAYLVRAAAQGLPEATKALNELSQAIQPLDRANGWQIATSLANSNGVPAQFQSGIQPPSLAAITTPPPALVLAGGAAATAVAASSESSSAAPQPGGSSITAALNEAALKTAGGPATGTPAEAAGDTADAAAPAAVPAPPAPVKQAEKPAPKAPEKVAEKPPVKEAKAAPKPPPPPPETGWRIQLGSYPSQKSAMQAWTKLAAANKRDTKGLKPNISRYGGMWRLQVGPFETRAEANKGCKTLEIGKNGCFAIDIGD